MTRTSPILWTSLALFGCAAGTSGGTAAPSEEDSLEACSDLADNDGDGFTDCRDPECGGWERCSDDFDPREDPDGLDPGDDDPGPGADGDGDDLDPVPDDGDVTEPGPAQGCDPAACVAAGGSHCCGDECINYYVDLDNCGACGAECRRGVCGASFCLCGQDLPDLCGNYDDAGHTCTNFATDHDNCGGCGQVCGADQTCCGGVCSDAC